MLINARQFTHRSYTQNGLVLNVICGKKDLMKLIGDVCERQTHTYIASHVCVCRPSREKNHRNTTDKKK